MSIVVEEGDVAEFTGKTKTFTRTGESGKPVHYEFCPDCGTTIRWRVDLIGGRQVYAVGALDDPKTIEIMSEMYTDFALPHARLGRELSCPGAPDNEFRKAAMAKANSLR